MTPTQKLVTAYLLSGYGLSNAQKSGYRIRDPAGVAERRGTIPVAWNDVSEAGREGDVGVGG